MEHYIEDYKVLRSAYYYLTFEMTQNNRLHFNIERMYVCIIWKLEARSPNKNLAKEYYVLHPAIATVWKSKDSVLLKMKWTRTTKYTKIERDLLK